MRHLISQGFLKQDYEREGVLSLKPKAIDLINGLITFYLPLPEKKVEKAVTKRSSKKKVSRKTKSRAKKVSKKVATKKTNVGRMDILKALKEKRREISKKKRIPAYKVFKDATLEEMAEVKPSSKDEMLSIYGVGDKNFKKFGKPFLQIIETF